MNKAGKLAKNFARRGMVHPWAAFDDFFRNWPVSEFEFPKIGGSDFLPSVDIKEDPKGFKIHTDLPGMKKENINLKLEKGLLTIEGERHEEKEEKDTVFHRMERKYGKFTRGFQLPESADASTLKARFVDGVLEISVEKKAKPDESLQIEIE